MTRYGRTFVALLVVCSAIAGGVSVVAAQEAYVSVSDVTVSPTSPAPGETVTVTAAIRNLAASSSTFTIESVELRLNQYRRYDRIEDLGTLAPGASLDVPLTVTFDETGVRRLTVVVNGHESDGDEVTTRYPVVVEVRDRGPQVNLNATSPVANADTPVSVTVANGFDEGIRNVAVHLGDLPTEQDRRVAAAISAGQSRVFTFTAVAERPGLRTVNATVTYTTASGVRRTERVRETLDFAPLRTDVDMGVSRLAGGSALSVQLTNLGNAPLHNVTVRGTTPDATVSSTTLTSVPVGGTNTAVVNVSDAEGAVNVSLVASYDVGDRHELLTRTVTVDPNPGVVALTGVDVQHENGKIHVTGSASNLGLSPVDSVVVSVVPTGEVTPAYPAKEYFVGTIPPSDFVSFDVYATVSPNATTVPLQATYLVNGQRHTREFSVALDDAASEPSPSSDDGGLPLLPIGISIIAVIGVATVMYIAWRNSRGSD